MHSLSGGTAAVGGDHISLCVLVKHNTQLVQPLNRVRGFHNQSSQQFRPCCKMSAAESIQIVLYRGVIFLVCCLDTALCHHGVGITDTQFCDDHNVCACLVSFDRSGRTCSAAADHQHVHVIIHFVQIYIHI